MRKGNGLGMGQMVAADCTLNPSINLAGSNAGGIGTLLGAFGGKAARQRRRVEGRAMNWCASWRLQAATTESPFATAASMSSRRLQRAARWNALALEGRNCGCPARLRITCT